MNRKTVMLACILVLVGLAVYKVADDRVVAINLFGWEIVGERYIGIGIRHGAGYSKDEIPSDFQ